MRSLTDSLAGIAGWVLFVGLCINFLMDRGHHWKIGSLGMPEIVVGPDGMHYPDGAVIDPVTLSLHQSGMEQEVCLALCGVLVLALLYLVYHVRKLRRMKRELGRLLGKKDELLRQSGRGSREF
jgi:hypothetical protein